MLDIFLFRRFIGPIIGGALTEMLDFQTSAAVRKQLFIVSFPIHGERA